MNLKSNCNEVANAKFLIENNSGVCGYRNKAHMYPHSVAIEAEV